MLKRHKNFNIFGGTSCASLFVLAFLLISPVASSAAYADEGEEAIDDASDELASSMNDTDGEIETYASTPSAVTISFSPTNASGTVTPIDSTTGDKAKVDMQAIVNVKNSGGYKVYVGSTSSQLKNGNNVIDSVTSAVSYANLPLNRWGYSFRKASGSTDKAVSDSYSAMPATLRSSVLDQNTSTNITDETTYYMLSFAARIGSDKPAGTYSNLVTFSVVSSPREVAATWAEITTMQEMTSTICANASSGASKQLKDTRDNKFYWVGKLADGKCWMTQNLDLDLSTSKALTSADSDVAASWTPGYNTALSVTTDTVLADNIGTRSWSLGDYRITNPTANSSCYGGKASAADCPNQFTAYNTPTSANGDTNAHYILGNHYQWNAATAGTGGSITSGVASSSVCPKGWRLPSGNTSGDFEALFTALGGNASSSSTIAQAPFFGVKGGIVYPFSSAGAGFFASGGYAGHYWTSTPTANASSAYAFAFGRLFLAVPESLSLSNATDSNSSIDVYAADDGTADGVLPSDIDTRYDGFSVRCVAR